MSFSGQNLYEQLKRRKLIPLITLIEFYISYIIDDKELFFNLNDRFFSYNRYCHENNTFLDEDIFDSIIELLNSYEIETLEDITRGKAILPSDILLIIDEYV